MFDLEVCPAMATKTLFSRLSLHPYGVGLRRRIGDATAAERPILPSANNTAEVASSLAVFHFPSKGRGGEEKEEEEEDEEEVEAVR